MLAPPNQRVQRRASYTSNQRLGNKNDERNVNELRYYLICCYINMRLKINVILSLGLAFLFFLFFQYTKHNPTLRPINVFGEGPYDAVGSFGIQLAFLASLVTGIRLIQSRKVETLKTTSSIFNGSLY